MLGTQRTNTIVASELTPATKLVLLHLLSISEPANMLPIGAGVIYAATTSTAKIADASGLTDRGVRKSLNMLDDANLTQDKTTASRGDRTWALNLDLIDDLPKAGAAA